MSVTLSCCLNSAKCIHVMPSEKLNVTSVMLQMLTGGEQMVMITQDWW